MHLWGYERGVDRVSGRFPVQNHQDLLGGLDGNLPLGLFGGGAQVGRHHDFWVPDQFFVLRRFLGEDVQGDTAQLARFQPVQDRLLVHQLATSHVDQPRSRLEQAHLFAADHVTGAVGQRSVQGDEV